MSYGYDPAVWKEQAREHWAEFQPTRFRELNETGKLEDALDYAVEQTWREMKSLMDSGVPAHEAWVMVRENYLILPEEPGLSDDEYETTPFNDIMNEVHQILNEDYQRQREEWQKEFKQKAAQTEEAIQMIPGTNQVSSPIDWLNLARWILMLPVAVTAAYLASQLALILTSIGMASDGYSTASFWVQFYRVTTENIALGAVLILAGSAIAPTHKHMVAISLAVASLLLTGFLVYPTLALRDYWALWGTFCLLAALLFSTVSVYRRHH